MFCCVVSWPLWAALTCLGAFAAWLKLADADLTLLFMSRWGRSTEALKGKVIWITGASGAVGEYLAYEFARVGSYLVLSDTGDENLEIIKNKCLEYGKDKQAKVFTLPFNVSDVSLHNEQLGKVIEHFGKLDILVNCVSRNQRAFFETIPIEVDQQIFNCNVFGPVSLIRCAAKYFKVNGVHGHVVVTGSLAGRLGMPLSSIYAASEHALNGYCDALRSEACLLGGVNITVACPGPLSHRPVRKSFIASSEKLHGVEPSYQSSFVSTARCARLIAVAVANKMDEVWISRNPHLIVAYLAQYLPSVFRNYIIKLFPKDIMMKLGEGFPGTVASTRD